MDPPTLKELRKIAEGAREGPPGVFCAVATPEMVLHLLDLIDGKVRNLP